MANQDIKIEADNPTVYNGDFTFQESDQQHIEDTIRAFQGWWGENPTDGVGIGNYRNSPSEKQELSKNIRLQLESDGYKVNNPQISSTPNGELLINPNATI
jgi:hypothetical protein